MSNSPERIWRTTDHVHSNTLPGPEFRERTEYVRADLVQELKNRIIELEETISGRYEQMEEE